MKKTMWAAMVALAIVAMIPLAAGGAQDAQRPQGPGRGMGRGFGPGGPGGPGLGIVHRLDLTEAQREQLEAILEERRASRPGAAMMELQKQLQTALFADTVDLAKVEELKLAIASAEAAMLSARIDTELKVNQVLTAAQRAKARELIAAGPTAGRGRGRRGF